MINSHIVAELAGERQAGALAAAEASRLARSARKAGVPGRGVPRWRRLPAAVGRRLRASGSPPGALPAIRRAQ
jgi:hypothetical protein